MDNTIINGQIAPSPGGEQQGGQGGGQSPLDPQLKKLLEMSKPTSHIVPPAAPSTKPGAGVTAAGVGMSMLMPMVGAGILYAAKKKKEEQVKQAVGDFSLLDALHQKAQMAAGDQNAPDYQKKVQQIYGDLISNSLDPKRIKNLFKTLFQDPLNPKSTVHGDALKQYSQIKNSEEKMKALSQIVAQRMMARSGPPQVDQQQVELMGQAERDRATTSQIQHSRALESEAESRNRETASRDANRHAEAEERIQNTKDYQAWREKHADATFEEKKREYQKTDEYKRWKEKLDVDTRLKIALQNQQKPSSTLQPVAVFSRTGLHMLDDAQNALDTLKRHGVLDGALGNKVEDVIFGKGFTDPRLNQEDRRLIGKVRSAMAYTSSAAMRAHTGRTSREIYDDFKNTLRIGQDLDALGGAIDETRSMMTEYANVITPEAQKSIREPVDGGSPQKGNAAPKIYKKGSIPKAD